MNTLLGTSGHITVLPLHGPIHSIAPWPIQSEPPWIAAEITTVSDLLMKLFCYVFMGVLCIPRLACVTGNCSAYVSTVTTSIAIETV